MGVKNPYDIINKDYGEYIVTKYCGMNASGSDTYEIKFKDTGNTYTRTRSVIVGRKVKDIEARMEKNRELAKERKKNERFKMNANTSMIGNIDFIYGIYQKDKPILVLDQSTTSTGYVVIKSNMIIEMGFITQNDKNVFLRISNMIKDVKALIYKHNIENLVLEDIFLGKNLYTYKILSCLLGCFAKLSIDENVSLTLFSSQTWREKYGFASNDREKSKLKAVNLVKRKFGLNLDIKENDLADALLMAMFVVEEINNDRTIDYDWN